EGLGLLLVHVEGARLLLADLQDVPVGGVVPRPVEAVGECGLALEASVDEGRGSASGCGAAAQEFARAVDEAAARSGAHACASAGAVDAVLLFAQAVVEHELDVLSGLGGNVFDEFPEVAVCLRARDRDVRLHCRLPREPLVHPGCQLTVREAM